MDYIKLKKTLLAVFDHFLSCYDMNKLEEMMQAFEAGKSLVIKLPEAVHREDYAEDVERMLEAPRPKKTVSRIRKKKPRKISSSDIKETKICDVPIFLDLAKLSQEKKQILKETLGGAHKITLRDVMIHDAHGFAKARVCKMVQVKSSCALSHEVLSPIQDEHSLSHKMRMQDHHSFSGKRKTEKSSDRYREKLIENIMFEVKKYKDPP